MPSRCVAAAGRRRAFAQPWALLAMATVAVGLTGCAGPARTWDQLARNAPPPDPAVAALPTPVVNPAADDYPWLRDYRHGHAARIDEPGEGIDLAMRHPEFPATHLAAVHIDLTSPHHRVYLVWAGPDAAACPTGPWRSCPGRGAAGFDCDNIADSNTVDSHCTPKGVFRVKGFSDHLVLTPGCLYATWVVHAPRYIAIHSHTEIPTSPASGGCIRVPPDAAKLIHNNAIAGVTLIRIHGRWTPGPMTPGYIDGPPAHAR